MGTLLCHGGDHADGGERVGGRQEPDEERETSPAGQTLIVVAQSVGRAVAAHIGLDGQRDQCDENGECGEGGTGDVHLGKVPVAKRADEERAYAYGVED